MGDGQKHPQTRKGRRLSSYLEGHLIATSIQIERSSK
jgi:hypothetical protein